jgi:HPt (histidine-containing phosphotransfer) domain-containing protein
MAQWLPSVKDEADENAIASDERPSNTEDLDAVIHTKALEMISSLDPDQGKELAAKVIGVYEENSIELIKVLSDALNDGDEDRIRTTAHALKSSSGNVGATRLMAMCRSIEMAAREKELTGLAEKFSAMQHEHSEVLDELRKWAQS